MRRMLAAALGAVLLHAGAQGVFAQSAAAAPSGAAQFTIAGKIISASTGQALDRADVTLSTPPQGNDPQGNQIAEAMTAEDGSFRFDRLQPGKYSLLASRRGYITGSYDAHEGFSTAILVGPKIVSGLDVTALRFGLLPEAVIGGTVTDEAGDALRRTQVMLYRQNTRNGLGNIVRASAAATDDTGAYEFARLQPGTYFVSVIARPWYATRPQPARDAQGNLDPSAPSVHSPLDVAYPVTFYANATDSENATPIPVHAGDRVAIDLSLHPVPSLHITFQRPTSSENGPNFSQFPRLTQNIFGSEEFAATSGMMVTRSRGSEIDEMSGIAPGHYGVQLSGMRGTGGGAGSLDLTGDQMIDPAALTQGVDLSGKVGMADGKKLAEGLSVSLVHAGDPGAGEGALRARVGRDGTFTLHGVTAGTWELSATAQGAAVAMTQMEASGATVEGDLLTVSSQPVTLAALLAEGETTVTGFAGRDDKPTPGVMVLLIPRDPKANRELFRRDQTGSDGSFVLRRVVPGSYTLVAIEDGWTLEWARPKVIQKYLARGQAVTVPSGRSDLSLPQPVETQPR